jgi:hypothetical protein
MTVEPNRLQAIFAIVAGILTIVKRDARIGPYWPPTFTVRGLGAILIGCAAILLGVWLLLVAG